MLAAFLSGCVLLCCLCRVVVFVREAGAIGVDKPAASNALCQSPIGRAAEGMMAPETT